MSAATMTTSRRRQPAHRIGHAIAALLPAETAADGPEMSRPHPVTTFVALSARREARHCQRFFKAAA